MAEKEETKKIHPLTPLVVFLVGGSFLAAIFYRFQVYMSTHEAVGIFFGSAWGFITGDEVYRDQLFSAYPRLANTVFILKWCAYGIAGLFIYGTIYSIRKLTAVNMVYRAPLRPPAGSVSHAAVAEEKFVNKKWETVLDHINSNNEGDWKLAIIEADIILDEMLTKMGYHGDSIGEKLKGVEQSDFTSLNSAWEAHKVRNQIAHEGASFMLSERQARNVIALYLEVFEEFKYV